MDEITPKQRVYDTFAINDETKISLSNWPSGNFEFVISDSFTQQQMRDVVTPDRMRELAEWLMTKATQQPPPAQPGEG